MGYILRPGFILPPLMFSEEELEAIVLGMRWVAKKTDHDLSHAAHNALAKIGAVLPTPLRQQLDLSGLLIGPSELEPCRDKILAGIREAIRKQLKLSIDYIDLNEKSTKRTIWPIGLGYFDQVRILIAWCELREDFRHFRADRITALNSTNTTYTQSRHQLLKKWREQNNIPPQ